MPKTTWHDIDEIIHKCKSTLTLAYNIESQSRKLRETIGEELTKLEEIILEQVNNE